MDWTERDGRWVSGPYTIELLAPEIWALSRGPEESAQTRSVEVENWWTGRSLKEMKRRAERIESDIHRARIRNRNLSISAGSLVVLFVVAGWSGPLAFALAMAASIAAMCGLARAIEHTLHHRPWDNVPEAYQ